MRGSRRKTDAYLVTTAAQSPQEELAARERRYLWTMGIRVFFFIAAILLYEFLPGAGAVRLVAAGLAMILPWIAVVAANAGPTRKPGLEGPYRVPTPPAIGGPSAPDTAPVTAESDRARTDRGSTDPA
jgi:peptidoglycan/LPS O-acetylase OafA/YrhL